MVFQIIITENCNLACEYCFEKKKNTINYISISSLVSFIQNYLKSRFVTNASDILVNITGGEPLLEFSRIEQLVLRIREIGITRFQISTNLTLLTNDMIQFIYKFNIELHVSLDGGKDSNNKHRLFPDKTGTFDIVNNNLNELKKMDY